MTRLTTSPCRCWLSMESADEGARITFEDEAPFQVACNICYFLARTRATYTNTSPEHFTWLDEKSDDGKSWTDFMIVECHRT